MPKMANTYRPRASSYEEEDRYSSQQGRRHSFIPRIAAQSQHLTRPKDTRVPLPGDNVFGRAFWVGFFLMGHSGFLLQAGRGSVGIYP